MFKFSTVRNIKQWYWILALNLCACICICRDLSWLWHFFTKVCDLSSIFFSVCSLAFSVCSSSALSHCTFFKNIYLSSFLYLVAVACNAHSILFTVNWTRGDVSSLIRRITISLDMTTDYGLNRRIVIKYEKALRIIWK